VSLKIVFTPRSQETLISVYEFIFNEFGKRAAIKYKDKADRVIKSISLYPYMFKASSFDESVRIGLITKQSSIVYQVTDTTIILHVFWDNRQEPTIL
jgi:plasmid stabilization system protein ParE